MEQNEEKVYMAHDKLFLKTFAEVENVRVFLNMVLPPSLQGALDLSVLTVENTNYLSDKLKRAASDLVVKTHIKKEHKGHGQADIYILMEHKSHPDADVLIQVLKYMYMEWQKDTDQKKPLRVIIPLIFYHGEKKWTVPRLFVDKFQVSPLIKEHLLNFSYLFFDTKDWDFRAKANQDLRNNVFLFTTLVLMKNAFNENMDVVHEILKLWVEKGFITEKERVTALLLYITEIRNVDADDLKNILEEHKINGGDFMPSLAQRLRDEGKEYWYNHWRKEELETGLKKKKEETAEEIASSMLIEGFDVEMISKLTKLPKETIEKLRQTIH